MTGRRERVSSRVVVALAAAAPALAACGGDGDGSPSAPSARELQQGRAALARSIATMKRKGSAVFTLTYGSDGVSQGLRARGAGTIDLRHARSRYRIRYEQAPGIASGTEVDLFSDGSTTYGRPAGRGLFERQPPSIVANGPADSLAFIATDSVGVHRTGTGELAGRSCTRYEGRLDFARIRRRAPAARRAEFDRQSRAIRTLPFDVCIDAAGVLREYRVQVRLPGDGDAVLRLVSRFTRVGSAAPIAALTADEKA